VAKIEHITLTYYKEVSKQMFPTFVVLGICRLSADQLRFVRIRRNLQVNRNKAVLKVKDLRELKI